MSRHNYTNPAFCQQSEFYPTTISPPTQKFNASLNSGNESTKRRIQRSVSTRSIQMTNSNNTPIRKVLNRSQQYLEQGRTPKINPFDVANRSGSGRYALVPVEELSTVTKDRYAIIPGPTDSTPSTLNRQERFSKSQDNIDRYSHIPVRDDESRIYNEETDTFTSLPPFLPTDEQPKLKSAFSSDFGSKRIVLVDAKSSQRYAMVPTEDDEDIVDENHEIIQMHNGRAHRYAVIPTEEDEEETCLSSSDLNQEPLQSSTPQKQQFYYGSQQQLQSYPNTPIKNPIATKKLHELLSTPRKAPNQRINTTPTNPTANITQSTKIPRRYQSQQQIYLSSQQINAVNRQDLTPQRLQYEQIKQIASLETSTSIVQQQQRVAQVPPRVAQSNQLDNNNDSLNKTWNNSYPQKVANATATLGVVSLMLTLGSALNSGLCIYLIANSGRSFYLEFGLTAAFSGVGLGILGFRSRHCEWLPNRSYISGYILVTVFCLLKCCGLLVLLALDPFPGMPLHDVTTGIVLGLSTFTLFFIGLGVIGSYWCYRPPPDNRVNVY